MTQRLLSPREEFQDNGVDISPLTTKKLTGNKRKNNQPIGKFNNQIYFILIRLPSG
jgi:hypothetical protein